MYSYAIIMTSIHLHLSINLYPHTYQPPHTKLFNIVSIHPSCKLQVGKRKISTFWKHNI